MRLGGIEAHARRRHVDPVRGILRRIGEPAAQHRAGLDDEDRRDAGRQAIELIGYRGSCETAAYHDDGLRFLSRHRFVVPQLQACRGGLIPLRK